MEHWIDTAQPWGRVLWLTDGNTRVGVALDFGLRVVHLSCEGMENLFYTQPADGSDGFVQENGWRLRGGHRFWLSPESDDSYTPDNAPVEYALHPQGVRLTQQPDTVLQVRKSLEVAFRDGCVQLTHQVENLASEPRTWALWGVNTLDGGEAEISFPGGGLYSPNRTVSLWGDTDLHDPRLRFHRHGLTVRHAPISGYCKLGLGMAESPVVLRNKGQQMEIGFDPAAEAPYPDKGCNFEVFMNSRFLELETLSKQYCLEPGEAARHRESWKVTPL